MTERPQLLVGAAIGLALIVCLAMLRMSLEKNDEKKGNVSSTRIQTVEETSRLSSASRRATVSRISETSSERGTSTIKGTRLQSAETKEDFEAQKFRAFGNESIFGHIYGDKGPLESATVQLYENDPMTKNPPLREAVTDKNGSYTLERLNDADMKYIFVIRAQNYASEAHMVNLSNGSMRRDERLRQGQELSGVVRDSVTSSPIANATVYYPTQSETVFAMLGTLQSGPAGQFSFPNVRDGTVIAYAEKDGYHRTARKIKTPEKEAEIPMTPGGATLRGVTISRLTKNPEGGAKVVLKTAAFSATTMSGTDGTFEMRDLPAGEFRLYAIKGMPSEEQAVRLADREVKEGVKITLPSPIFVTGKVIHAYESHPLPGIKVHYDSPAGKKGVITDELGQFGFETFALKDYGIEIHEKGYLPFIDKRSTGSVERITRKITSGAASDQITIKLRPVLAIAGKVRMQGRNRESDRGGNRRTGTEATEANARPVFGASVAVAYLQGKTYERVMTRTDAAGNFFVNLPERQPAQAKVIVQHRGLIAVESTRAPQRQKLELLLRPDYFAATLALSDGSSLSGVLVKSSYYFPDNRKPEDAIALPAGDIITGRGGRFFLTLAEKQEIGLRFFLPDGKNITKVYNTARLRRRSTFVYDPIAGDIVTDAMRDSKQASQQNQQRRTAGDGQNQKRNQAKPQNKPAQQ